MKGLRIFTILITGLLLASCTLFEPLKISKPQNLKVDRISFTGVEMQVGLKVVNPNFYKIKVQGVDLNLSINDIDFGRIEHRREVEIKRKSSDVVNIPFKIGGENLLVKAIALVRSMVGNEVDIHVKGKVKAKGLIFKREVEVDMKKAVKLIK